MTGKEAFEQWLQLTHAGAIYNSAHRDHDELAFLAGAAHGAAEERAKIEAIIAVIRDEYDGHAVDNFVNDLHKRLKQERRRGEK